MEKHYKQLDGEPYEHQARTTLFVDEATGEVQGRIISIPVWLPPADPEGVERLVKELRAELLEDAEG